MNAQTQLCTGGIKSFIKGFTSVLQAKLLKANNDLEPGSPELEGTHRDQVQLLAPRIPPGAFYS